LLQANGLVERQNRTIKEKLLKILNEDHLLDWPKALNGVLFAHRTACHNSTGYSPFRILYGREAVLPIDVKYTTVDVTLQIEEFDEKYVKHVVEAMTKIHHTVDASTKDSIKKAQANQCHVYNERHKASYKCQSGDKVLLKNLKRADRKGGKHSMPWLGPYTVSSVFENNTCSLVGARGELKSKQHLCNVKQYIEREEDQIAKLPNPDAVIEQTELGSVIWVESLHLKLSDRTNIENRYMLDDAVVDAAQTLLKRAYPVDGLNTTLLSQGGGFKAVSNQCVQIHYDANRQHWITSSSTRGRVEVADSLFNGSLSESVCTQLKQLYASLNENTILPIFVLPVQRQSKQ